MRKQRGGDGRGRNLVPAENSPAPPDPGAYNFQVKFPNLSATPEGPETSVSAASLEPQVSWTPASPAARYTILCWDPDAPARAWVHWLVVNCTGGGGAGSVKSGEVIAPWTPPAPPPGTGQHRYIFGLFEHVGQSPIQIRLTARGGFSVTEFLASGVRLVAYTGIRVASAEGAPSKAQG
jgi:hypothetical protein